MRTRLKNKRLPLPRPAKPTGEVGTREIKGVSRDRKSLTLHYATTIAILTTIIIIVARFLHPATYTPAALYTTALITTILVTAAIMSKHDSYH